MKTGFHIPPSTAESHLLLEVRDNGFCLLWYLPEPLVVTGYAACLLEPYETVDTGLASLIQQFDLSSFPAERIRIYYNTTECTYIPVVNAPDTDTYGSLLQLMHGENQEAIVFTSSFNQEPIKQVFRISKALKTLTDSFAPYHIPAHVHANIAAHLPGDSLLYCHVFYDNISIMLRKSGKWQFFQQFPYQSPEDISYHLIHVCEKHGMEVASTPLLLSGMITPESNLYQQLYNFFLAIHFLPLPATARVEDHLKVLPLHFITPLTCLASCAS